MSTVIQKYKKLIGKKEDLKLNHQFLDLELKSLVRGRKGNRTSYNNVINKHYKKGNFSPTEKTELMIDIENSIGKKTKAIKETLSKLKESKKKLRKVKIELSNLCR